MQSTIIIGSGFLHTNIGNEEQKNVIRWGKDILNWMTKMIIEANLNHILLF